MAENRIEKKFQELKGAKKKAFIAFVTAGFPNIKTTEKLVVSLEKNGVDVIELGVPFSDPLADGPTIQAASQIALDNKLTLKKILKTVLKIRKKSSVPIALMTYYNPVFHYGEKKFIKDAKRAGVDGIIVPDLPTEEAKSLAKYSKEYNISTIFFVSPTTQKKRIRQIARLSTGFIYYVSVTGVTGARRNLPRDLREHVRMVKAMTSKPVCVGFGISTPSQVKSISRCADGVIIGSAIIKEIFRVKNKTKIIKSVNKYVKRISKALE